MHKSFFHVCFVIYVDRSFSETTDRTACVPAPPLQFRLPAVCPWGFPKGYPEQPEEDWFSDEAGNNAWGRIVRRFQCQNWERPDLVNLNSVARMTVTHEKFHGSGFLFYGELQTCTGARLFFEVPSSAFRLTSTGDHDSDALGEMSLAS